MNDKIDETKLPPVPGETEPNITSYYGPEKETEELKKELGETDKDKQDQSQNE